MSHTLTISKNRKHLIIWILLLLMPIVGMAVDLITPSLPSMAISLDISSSDVKNVVSFYLFGYALGNFFIGFLTDALGRQKIMRICLASFILISLIPIFFPKIHLVLLTRFLQGVSLGGATVTSRAIYSDLLTPEELTPMGILIGSMFGLGPVIGPWIGGYLETYFGWQSCFSFFAIVISIEFVFIFLVLPETHFRRQPLKSSVIFNNFMTVIYHRRFFALIIIMGCTYSLMIVFNTVGPFLIQTKLQHTPIFFGRVALTLGVVFLIATFFCKSLLNKYSADQLLLFFINIFFIISIVNLILSYIFDNNLLLIGVASSCMFFATGFIYPLCLGSGLSLFQHIAGTATAAMIFLNVLMTGIVGFIVSLINMQDATFLMWVNFILIFIALVIYWTQIHQFKRSANY